MALVGCGRELPSGGADAPVEDTAPHHGTIQLYSGGSQLTAPKPSVIFELPDDPMICASDVTIDSCRIRRLCNAKEQTMFAGGNLALGTTPPITIESTVVPRNADWHDAVAFSGGEAITMAIDGTGALPPMSTSVVAPAQVTITSRFDTPVPPMTDYTVTWTGGTTGVVELGVDYGTDGDFMLLNCRFPAAAEQGTISAAALAAFGFDGTMGIGVSNVTTVESAHWTVDFTVTFYALTPGRFGLVY